MLALLQVITTLVLLNGDQLQAGAGWKFVQINATIPSVQGKDIRDGSFFAPEIVFQNPGNNVVIDVAQMKMEIGDSATDFRIKHDSIEEELRGCQRFYWRWNATSNLKPLPMSVVKLTTTNAQIDWVYEMPSAMQRTPSLQISDITHFEYAWDDFTVNLSPDYPNISIAEADNISVSIRNQANSNINWAGMEGSVMVRANNTTNAWVELDAEFAG